MQPEFNVFLSGQTEFKVLVPHGRNVTVEANGKPANLITTLSSPGEDYDVATYCAELDPGDQVRRVTISFLGE